MQEMSLNFADKIRDIVISMQSEGTLHQNATLLDHYYQNLKPDKNDESFSKWKNDEDATAAIQTHNPRSSLQK